MQSSQTASGTVKKALSVLDQVASFERPVRLNELVEVSPYPKGTLYRMLQTLRSEGMLTYDETKQAYSLGIRLVRLAHTAWTQSSLAPTARPILDALSKSIGETIHLAQLDNAQVLYVDKRNAQRPVEMFSQAGKVGPAYCTGVGKAMLAFLPETELQQVLEQQSYHRFTPHTLGSVQELRDELSNIRTRGYAYDREEHEPGIICIAMPILTRTKRVMGAISVTSTTSRTSLDQLEALAPKMHQAADAIAETAVHWRFPVEQKTKEKMEG
ncbi:IclR family transcriptional regulator [Litoreibacter halocynthiae]|uniref:IclR family transcriptional regulator n=1 Tax=Litoreibacter halocynthiae TaxID=1242689 RepID=A0A4R7LLR3_9RHOB|nr:IclR family transcriptional regulator [Litoreibacter halocynthiae]TDT75622.1 IclR family transcriptional regulator [Litoreibacter halocynthiae]